MSEPLRSHVAQFVIDVGDLEEGVTGQLSSTPKKKLAEESQSIYRRFKLPDSAIRILVQRTDDPNSSSKERMHLDLETNDVDTRCVGWTH